MLSNPPLHCTGQYLFEPLRLTWFGAGFRVTDLTGEWEGFQQSLAALMPVTGYRGGGRENTVG